MKSETNEKFREIEKAYLTTRSPEDFQRLYEFARRYLAVKIANYANERKLFFGDLEEKAHDGATWFSMRYINSPTFHVDKFTVYICFAFKKVMYDPKNKERELFEKKVAASVSGVRGEELEEITHNDI